MIRWIFCCAILLVSALLLIGCNTSNRNPIAADFGQPTSSVIEHPGQSNSHLWGYFDVYIDLVNKSVECIPNRSVMFAANIVRFLNATASIQFEVCGIAPGSGRVDVDIDVAISHPFPGMTHYNGYDVRGIFIGDGSTDQLWYDPSMSIADKESHQLMYDFGEITSDPHPGQVGMPDGYTRWWNPDEFNVPGTLGYTEGIAATSDYYGNAHINPCKYFADDLNIEDDLWTFLNDTGDYGVFSSGTTNRRNYYLRFPVPDPGVKFNYAVIANWEAPDIHPSNAPEAVACRIIDNSSVYYISHTNLGGSLKLDFSLFNWENLPSTIYIDSLLLDGLYYLNTEEMIPIESGSHFATWRINWEADGDFVEGTYPLWIIAEYDGFDYTNDFGIPNNADTDTLASFFRYEITVGDSAIEVTYPNIDEEIPAGQPVDITWTSAGVDGTVFIEYSSDNFVFDCQTIATDELNDGVYTWDIPCETIDPMRIRVSSTIEPEVNDISDGNNSIVEAGWVQAWGSDSGDHGADVVIDADDTIITAGSSWNTVTSSNDAWIYKYGPCGELLWSVSWGHSVSLYGNCGVEGLDVDSPGNIFAMGNFDGTVDFNPDDPGGPYTLTADGIRNIFLCKYDSDGNFQWAKVFGGGGGYAYGYSSCTDSPGNSCITGYFRNTIDFDPDNPGGPNQLTSVDGSSDFFLSCFDPSGVFQWVTVIGADSSETGYGVDTDNLGNIYATGLYSGTVDFDPGDPGGPNTHTSTSGTTDSFLCQFDSSGGTLWSRVWGGHNSDWGHSVIADGAGTVYVMGGFLETVDFDPDPVDEEIYTAVELEDIFLSRFDSTGDFSWARAWGGTGHESGRGLAADSSGNAYVAGEFANTPDFDPGPGVTEFTSVFPGDDAFLTSIDQNGNFRWAHAFINDGYNNGWGVDCDSSGDVYTIGKFSGTIDFAPTDPPCNTDPDEQTSLGDNDVYLVKHRPDGCW